MEPMKYRRGTQFASRILTVCAVALMGIALGPASASAVSPQLWQKCDSDEPIEQQCFNPRGVAANPANGHVLMADLSNGRVIEFTAWGEFLRTWGWDVVASGPGDDTVAPEDEFEICVPGNGDSCQEGVEGELGGQFTYPLGVALDSEGNVYVTEASCCGANHRVQKFSPAGQFLLTFGTDVNKTKVEAGAPEAERNLCTAASGDVCQSGGSGTGNGQFGEWAEGNFIAIDRNGTATDADDKVYVGDEERIQRFDVGGVYQDQIALPGETVQSLAVDSSGNLYVGYGHGANIEKLSPAGTPLSPTFELPKFDSVESVYATALALDPAGHLYALREPSGGNSIARDRIFEFDPAGNIVSSFGVSSFGKGEFGSSTGLAVNPVTAAGDLALYVANLFFPSSFLRAYSPIPDIAIAGPPPERAPSIVSSRPLSVDVDEATVRAAINPHFWADASYYVEYGTEDCASSACAKAHFPGLPLGAGVVDSPAEVDVTLEGLEPDTTYHFRFVAQSSGGGPTIGLDRTFTTFPPDPAPRTDCSNQAFRKGAGALLRDCRAYEMVTPLDKNGGDIRVTAGNPCTGCGRFAEHLQTTPEGDKLTYATGAPFGDANAGTWSVHYFASRDPGQGWSSHSIEPPQGLNGFAFEKHFEAFSEDLSTGWLWQEFDPQPSPDGVPGYHNLYRRDNLTDTYTALTTVKPPTAGLARSGEGAFEAKLGGFSADGSMAAFFANDRVAGGASTATEDGKPIFQVYQYRDGEKPRLVSRLPNGTASGQHSTVGGGQSFMTRAVSEDGQRIYWTTGPGGPSINSTVENHEGTIYLRLGGMSTAQVSETASPKPAQFWVAAKDGSAALFTIDAGPFSAGDLYRFDLASEESSHIASGIVAVAGASEDLNRLYFLSHDVLDPNPNSEGDTATPSNPGLGISNLYYYEDGAGISFVAQVGEGHRIYANGLGGRKVRVSRDGRHIAFVDRRALTGVDSGVGPTFGLPVYQVFRYSADSDELSCVSCNSTGAPALAHFDPESGEVDIAGYVSGWRNGPFYQQRFLSEDGSRVYFFSYDRLLPADTNGKSDVYQWQAPGTGECTIESAHYFAVNEGCIELLSTGKSAEESDFIEATPDGSTVFIRTAERLVGHDTDELLDIYAVRTGGGFPEPKPAPAPCEGDACRGAAPPDPPNLGAGTAAFQGPGNPQAKQPKPRCPKAKRQVRRRGKVRCVPKRRQQRRAANSNRRAKR